MELTKKLLITILTLFLVIFFLFMSLTIYSSILVHKDFINEHIFSKGDTNIGDALRRYDEDADNVSASVVPKGIKKVMIVDCNDDVTVRIAREWCMYYKYSCSVTSDWPTPEAVEGYDILILTGLPDRLTDTLRLEDITETGISIIFTDISDIDKIEKSDALKRILGIEELVEKSCEIDGIRLFGDFYLSKDRLYQDDDDYGKEDDMHKIVPYFHLRPGYDVYAMAILKDQDERGIPNEKMPPLLWKTVTKSSNVFVINCDSFSGNALLGTLTGFASRTDAVFVYPVVNAQSNCIINYPWMMTENDQALEKIYGHRADTLSWSILWPGIVQTLYSYHQTADFYVSAQTDYSVTAYDSNNMAANAVEQIRKQLGTMGLTLDQNSNEPLESILKTNERFFADIVPMFKFSSVYAGGFEPSELSPYLSDKNGILGDVSLVTYNRKTGEPLISSIADDVLLLGLTSYGFRHEAEDDIDFIATQTALALDLQYIDMKRVLYPEGRDDYWNNLSIDWASAITYYNNFSDFDFVLADEMEERVRNLVSLDYSYSEENDVITINVKRTDASKPAYFILRMFTASPEKVSGGSLTKLSDTAYLIKAEEDQVVIEEKQLFKLDGPK